MPVNLTLGKIGSLTGALCKLHNYCIDQNETVFVHRSSEDTQYISSRNGVPLVGPNCIPLDLLIDEDARKKEDPYGARNIQRSYSKFDDRLLRTHIFNYIVEHHYKRKHT